MHSLVEGNVQAVGKDDTPIRNGTGHALKEFARRERTIRHKRCAVVEVLCRACRSHRCEQSH